MVELKMDKRNRILCFVKKYHEVLKICCPLNFLFSPVTAIGSVFEILSAFKIIL